MLFLKNISIPIRSGVCITVIFALCSYYLAGLPGISALHVNPLIIAILLGIIYGSTLRRYLPHTWTPGIQFVSKRILRLAIIFYGFRLTFQEVLTIGWEGLIIDVGIVALTMLLGTLIGIKVLKLDRDTSLLISCGAAICGAAAVLATELVLKSEAHKAAVAIISVVLFGTAAMFLYPLLQQNAVFGLDNYHYGIYAGATIHEVAQALVAGSTITPDTGNTAVIVKMTRVMLLVPVLFILTLFLSRPATSSTPQHHLFASIPWFTVGFIVLVGVNSLHWLSAPIVTMINTCDAFLLTIAMAAIGMETNLSKVKHIGLKPLYLSLILFIWLLIGGYGLSLVVFHII